MIRRIYVIERNSRPMECHFSRAKAGAALASYRLLTGVSKVVPYAPLLPARRKKREAQKR
jgi:hypothetical protein